MAGLRNFVSCATATTGAGTVTLGAAVPGHRTFASAYPSGNTPVSYMIADGFDRETGYGVYNRAANTLTRQLLDSTTGALLNLSGNAVASVDFLAQDYAGDWPSLIVNRQESNFQYANSGNGFFTVQVNAVVLDTHAGWNPDTFTWLVPQTGLYDIQGKLRLTDNASTGGGALNFGIGLGTANEDNPSFLWGVFPYSANVGNGTSRFVLYNSRLTILNAGQQLRLFAYTDTNGSGGIGLSSAELVANRIR